MLEVDVAVVAVVVVAEDAADAAVHHRQEAAVEAAVEEKEERGEVLVATRSETCRASQFACNHPFFFYILIAYPHQYPRHSHSYLHTQPILTASFCHNRPPIKTFPTNTSRLPFNSNDEAPKGWFSRTSGARKFLFVWDAPLEDSHPKAREMFVVDCLYG